MKELIITVGLPASGKTTEVNGYVSKGYFHLSRDIEGGDIPGLMKVLEHKISEGVEKIIMDNTSVTNDLRKDAIEIGKRNGFYVKCLYFTTSIEECMVNSVSRMIQRYGKVLHNDELKKHKDPNMFPIAVLYSMKKRFETPSLSEGFDEIVKVPFVRKDRNYTNKAILFDYDGTLRKTKSGNIYPTNPEDIEILPGRKEKLAQLMKEGYILLGVSNQSGVAKGHLTHDMATKCFEKTNELLGADIDFNFCPHTVPPIVCYCRKPGVGMGIEFIEKYKLDVSQCIVVGDMTTDETFAKRCGFKYIDQSKFFK